MLKQVKGELTVNGWIREALRRDAEGITGHLDEIFADAGASIFGSDRVTHREKGYWSSWWPGEVSGNWLEGLTELAFLLKDRALTDKVDAVVRDVLAHQDEDGYIGIYQKGHRFVVTARYGELWTQSRIMRVLLAYHRHTGDERVRAALIRMADCIVAATPASLYEIPDEDGSKGHGLMIIDGMFELYRMTGDPAYRDFCVRLYRDYCDHPSRFMEDDLRFANLFDPGKPFVGHGPHTCESIRIPRLLYEMTGDETYRKAYDAAMAKLEKNLTLSGSCKSDEFIGTYQNTLVMENDERSDVFGGSVPLPSVGYEYCSTVELALDYLRAQELTGDGSYADRLEWLVFNAGMASRHPSGKMIQYLGADNMYDASAAVNPRFDYSPTHDDAAGCCAANAGRLLPLFVRNCFLTDGERLIANHPMSVTLQLETPTGALTVRERTNYPFGESVSIAVSGNGSTAFAIRIPAFADGYAVYRNGQPARGTAEGGRFLLKQPVTGGDRITVRFRTLPRLLRAPDGTSAVACGALLFALPIPAARMVRRSYGRKGFHDIDYVPKPHSSWEYTLLADREGGCRFTGPQLMKTGYPMEKGHYVLKVRSLDRYAYPVSLALEPIGATTLRRTTFPLFRDEDKIYGEENL